MIKPLTIIEVELIAYDLAKQTPLPNVLESCLVAPFATYDKKNLYLGLHEKAAMLFYLMVKNHPFQNGNKRIAITTLLLFMAKNKKWLKVDPESLYNSAVWVAESPADFKDQVLQAFAKFIKKYKVKKV